MVSRLALSRIAPVLSNARPSSSATARRALRAARGYATADNDNHASHVTHILTQFSDTTGLDDRPRRPQRRNG